MSLAYSWFNIQLKNLYAINDIIQTKYFITYISIFIYQFLRYM